MVHPPKITRVQYDLLLDAYRVHKHNHLEASRAAGVTRDVAAHVFTEDVDELSAIGTVLRDELIEAQTKLARYSSDGDHEKMAEARADLLASRSNQARALKMTRANAIGAMALSDNLLKASVKLSLRLTVLMDDEEWKPTPVVAIRLMRTIMETAKMASDMNLIAETVEARVFGDRPDFVVGAVEMTPSEAVATLRSGNRTLARLERRKLQSERVVTDVQIAALQPSNTETP